MDEFSTEPLNEDDRHMLKLMKEFLDRMQAEDFEPTMIVTLCINLFMSSCKLCSITSGEMMVMCDTIQSVYRREIGDE